MALKPMVFLPDWDYTYTGGWISKDGTMYQAEYEEHFAVARRIVKSIQVPNPYNYGPMEQLITAGWIQLETSGKIWHPFQPTSSQFDTLHFLYTHSVYGAFYNAELWLIVEPLMRELVPLETFPLVPPQGDQENMKKGHHYER